MEVWCSGALGRPKQKVLGGRLKVYCRTSIGFNPNVEIKARLAYKTGEGENGNPLFKDVGEMGSTVFRAKWAREVPVEGFNATCTAEMSGEKEYIIRGTIHYRTSAGVPRHFDFETEKRSSFPNGPEKQTCPGPSFRINAEASAWRHLARRRDDDNRYVRYPSKALRHALGDDPGYHSGTPGNPHRPPKLWEAHHIIPATSRRARAQQALGFRCRVHPNERANGIYLRGFGYRKTTASGASNAHYQRLKERRPDLAKRQYHGDTLRSDYYDNLAERTQPLIEDTGDGWCSEGEEDRLREVLSHGKTDLADGEFVEDRN